MRDVIVNAYREIVLLHQCSADDIIECPLLRNLFLDKVRAVADGTSTERAILHELTKLRKKKLLPRKRDLVG